MINLMILMFGLQIHPANDTIFRSIEGGFEVKVPGDMVHHIEHIATDIGEIAYHSYYYSSVSDTSGNFIYVISFYQSEALDFPSDSISLINDFFDSTVEQAALNLQGEVLILDDITYHGKYPGKFWRIHYNGGRSVMKTKAFLVGNTYYSVQVAVDAQYSLSELIDTFMDSFKLIST